MAFIVRSGEPAVEPMADALAWIGLTAAGSIIGHYAATIPSALVHGGLGKRRLPDNPSLRRTAAL